MAVGGAYNETVRRHFANPLHAGELPPGYARTRTVEVSGGDCQIVLAAGLSDGRIGALRYRVFGCPHMVAALEVTCGRLEGRDSAELEGFSAAELAGLLELPLEKTGRILLLEDAVRGLSAAIRGTKGPE
jgi:NifU-like protein involved in Fe-S cluster formation